MTAEVLLCFALRREKPYLYAHPEEELSRIGWIHFGRYLHERLKGKPTQYITKRQEFYGRVFRVTPAVLIPRPETELLVEAALRFGPPEGRVLDVGCGSGAIAVTLSLEWKRPVFATDVSTAAIAVARHNAETLGAEVRWTACDLGSAFWPGAFAMVVSNPPYVPLAERESLAREVRDWEPALALFGGEDGLDILRRLVADTARLLTPGGRLLVEIASGKAEESRGLLGENWTEVTILPDLAGLPRILTGRLGRPRPA